jgi:hypothetical protein
MKVSRKYFESEYETKYDFGFSYTSTHEASSQFRALMQRQPILCPAPRLPLTLADMPGKSTNGRLALQRRELYAAQLAVYPSSACPPPSPRSYDKSAPSGTG